MAHDTTAVAETEASAAATKLKCTTATKKPSGAKGRREFLLILFIIRNREKSR